MEVLGHQFLMAQASFSFSFPYTFFLFFIYIKNQRKNLKKKNVISFEFFFCIFHCTCICIPLRPLLSTHLFLLALHCLGLFASSGISEASENFYSWRSLARHGDFLYFPICTFVVLCYASHRGSYASLVYCQQPLRHFWHFQCLSYVAYFPGGSALSSSASVSHIQFQLQFLHFGDHLYRFTNTSQATA